MTTAAKPLPPHGSYARANGSPGYRKPCYCEPCVIEKRRARKRSKVNRELGRSRFTSTARARQHLIEIHKTMAWSDIAAASGVDDRSLCLIYSGRRERISLVTERKILAVQAESASPGQYVDVTGSMRRIRALMSIGHSGRVIAEAVGSSQARIHLIAAGKQATIRRGLALRIEAACERLAQEPVEDNHFTRRVRNGAARKGWRDPQWWEDYGHIDDPTFDPDKADRVLSFHERARLRREEIEHLAWCGHEPDQILDRLNGEVSISTVRQIVQEWRTGQKRDRRLNTERTAA
ncbi:hypothetical protein [Streptomyces sp. HC307]|uniref:hypothetical protein n=1 Tax=Streptomyces flavusporus TaxID=3385496 RepID=UPI0039174AFA